MSWFLAVATVGIVSVYLIGEGVATVWRRWRYRRRNDAT